MKKKILSKKQLADYHTGKGCNCGAYSYEECRCPEADWTEKEVYELRLENSKLQKSQISMEKAVEIISKLVSLYRSNHAFWDSAKNVFGTSPESPIFEQIFINFNAYVDAISSISGISKENIDWFLYDNDCGKKGLNVYIDDIIYTIKSPKDFVECELELKESAK